MAMQKNIVEEAFPEALKILSDLIKFQTVSGTSNIKLIDYCEKKLSLLGAESFKTFDEEKLRVNLFSTINSKKKLNGDGIILSGHTDVVPASLKEWSSNPFTASERENKIYGRGSCDMKGFIACTLALAPYFAKADLKKPIHFSYTYDEETACQGAPVMLKELKKRKIACSICIVGEPTSMKAIQAHKGCYEYSTHFLGLAGHGSAPDKGVNAVEYATKFINRLMELREELKKREPKNSVFIPPYTTLQIGRIKGGIARNVIADQCVVDWELRPVVFEDGVYVNKIMDDYVEKNLLPEMKKIYSKSEIKKEIIGEIVGFNKEEKSEAVDLICNLTRDNSRDVVSFGTEAGLFQELGISTVVCGPGSIEQAHKIDEYISYDQMKLCLKMLVDLKHQISN
jgi:acetylornithine deacetylase